MLHLRDIWKTKPFWIFIVLMALIFLGGNTAIASRGTSSLQQQQVATKVDQPRSPINNSNVWHTYTEQAKATNNPAE